MQKDIFPFEFVTENILFYIGNTPLRKFYIDLIIDEYNKLKNDNLNTKNEAIK